MSFTPPIALSPLTLGSPTVTGDTLSIDTSVLPLTVNADLNTTRIEVSIYGTTYVLTNPTVVSGVNQFTGSVPINTSIQNALIQFIGREYNPWQTNTPYPLSYQVLDTNGNLQAVVQAGISGITTPSWGTSGDTDDGSVVWSYVGPFTNPTAQTTWVYGTSYAVGSIVIDSNGNAQSAISGGTSGTATPTWGDVIQQHTTDGNVVWVCVGPGVTPIFKFNLIFFNSGLALQIGPPSTRRRTAAR
jgi:hypothetical protein